MTNLNIKPELIYMDRIRVTPNVHNSVVRIDKNNFNTFPESYYHFTLTYSCVRYGKRACMCAISLNHMGVQMFNDCGIMTDSVAYDDYIAEVFYGDTEKIKNKIIGLNYSHMTEALIEKTIDILIGISRIPNQIQKYGSVYDINPT